MLSEYDDCNDNKRLTMRGTGNVFFKTGHYIINIGVVNFFEYLIINLLLVIYVYQKLIPIPSDK